MSSNNSHNEGSDSQATPEIAKQRENFIHIVNEGTDQLFEQFKHEDHDEDTDGYLTDTLDNTLNRRFKSFLTLRDAERRIDEGYSPQGYTVGQDRISPSAAGGCQRQAFYRMRDAPREEDIPRAIFDIGVHIESVVYNFLQQIFRNEAVIVDNVEEINFTVDGINLPFSGSTDPVLKDPLQPNNPPFLLTEVKSTKNPHFIKDGGAKDDHRHQAHIYSYGLAQNYNLNSPPPIVYLYVSKQDYEIYPIYEEFNWDFWNNEVLEWAEEYASTIEAGKLPDPINANRNHWKCDYCDWKERCGDSADSEDPTTDIFVPTEDIDDSWFDDRKDNEFQQEFRDQGAIGFLPRIKYPEDTVVGHLLTYDVPVTPTIAYQHPHLLNPTATDKNRLRTVYGAVPENVEVTDWVCETCGATHSFEAIEWDGEFESGPYCPHCPDESSTLRGRAPDEM